MTLTSLPCDAGTPDVSREEEERRFRVRRRSTFADLFDIGSGDWAWLLQNIGGPRCSLLIRSDWRYIWVLQVLRAARTGGVVFAEIGR